MPLPPKKQTGQFGLNDQTGVQQPQRQQAQMPDLMGLLGLLQQGTQQNIQAARAPVSGISKDQHTQRGTPGLDQWHKNNPDAPKAGTFQPDGNYGQIGQDMYVGPAPQAEATPPPGHAEGFMQMLGNGLMHLLGGGQGGPQMQGPPKPSQSPMAQAQPQQPQNDTQAQTHPSNGKT